LTRERTRHCGELQGAALLRLCAPVARLSCSGARRCGGRRLGLAVLLASSSAALLAAPAAETAPAATAKSPWQLFGRTTAPVGYALLGPFWASDRVWLISQSGDAGTLASAQVSGRALRSFTVQRIIRGEVNGVVPTGSPVVDGRLIVRTDDRFATAALLPDGRLAPATAVPDDLLARATEANPRVTTAGIEAAVRVGGRIVWALKAGERAGIGGGKQYQLVCCSESGAAVDLTRFIDQAKGVLFVQLGVDTHGRIWLAWLDLAASARGAVRGVPRIIELDPSSLSPRTPPLGVPRIIADRLKLACASSCRAVAQTAAGDLVSWAPSERSPTRVATHWECGNGYPVPRWLLAASYRSGNLVVAYQGAEGKTKFCDASVRDKIHVVRGDESGARVREVATIPVANAWPPQNVSSPTSGPIVSGALTPTAFIAVEFFEFTRNGQSSPVIGAVVPFGR
jgi:hypothetical protein